MTTLEHRAYDRHTLYRLATITGPGAENPQVCIVRDVSRDGALIEATTVDGVPSIFRLSVAGMSAGRFCMVVRRTLDMLAVSFIDAPASKPLAAAPSILDPAAGALLMVGQPAR